MSLMKLCDMLDIEIHLYGLHAYLCRHPLIIDPNVIASGKCNVPEPEGQDVEVHSIER